VRLTNCPNCGAFWDGQRRSCWYCGHETTSADLQAAYERNLERPVRRSRTRTIGWLAGALSTLLVLSFLQLSALAFISSTPTPGPTATSTPAPTQGVTPTPTPRSPSQKELAAAYLLVVQPDAGVLAADMKLDCNDLTSCRSAYSQIGRDAGKARDHIAGKAVSACIARGASDYQDALSGLIGASDVVVSGFDQDDIIVVEHGTAQMEQAIQGVKHALDEFQSASCPG